MGYYTNFTLSIHEGEADLDAVRESITKISGGYTFCYYTSALRDNALHSEDAYKWYEFEDDCKKLSLEYSGVVFKLHGEGEEAGDLWDAYFKDGKSQTCKASLAYPPYDPLQLT